MRMVPAHRGMSEDRRVWEVGPQDRWPLGHMSTLNRGHIAQGLGGKHCMVFGAV